MTDTTTKQSQLTCKYKAVAIREDDRTGIGILRYLPETRNGGATLEIHSIYCPDKLSHKQTFLAVMQHINVDDGESALLRTAMMNVKYQWAALYPNVFVKGERYNIGAHSEVLRLAEDALRRKSTIYEEEIN
ncbi:hypothetical protein [Virgibacillus necropolis]|uniref:Uncharacterized protein n=1 Tax=Virgibacillus necropolis TaxID=163877 RepID=A0A221MGT3_9BACI|nr:hypothetical protein [Virgibacillus necropolis]ASN06844.1 hypothetical protein CFK40_18365 [Virgibacillus necropolis]